MVEGAQRVLVAGCGAIGSVFACMLAQAGHGVSVLARPELAVLAAGRGLEVVGIWGRHRCAPLVAASSAGELGGTYDAVLVACKSFDTAVLAAQLAGAGVEARLLISTQNGLGNVEAIQAVYGAGRVLAARVIFGAAWESGGVVRVTVEAEPVLLGNLAGGTDPRADTWAGIVDSSGINCRPSRQVAGALWGKVFYNAALNPLGAIHGLSYGELAADSGYRDRMDRAIGEAFAVARAEGVEMPWTGAAEYLEVFYERLVPRTAGHRSSMLQDIENGKPTEIDAITGQICRRGAEAGIETPENERLMAAVKEIEEAR
ncbi:MAG: ketopantoate reductase family protein [Deltaproteobacteria bacterium]